MKHLGLLFLLCLLNLSLLAQNWSTLGSGMNGEIDALLEDTVNGVLYAGGMFSIAGGNAINNIAMWDGSSWTSLSGGTNSVVNDLAIFNGELYAVGSFSSPGNHIAKWNGSSWSAVGGGTNSSAFALQVFNGALYVGGVFTQAGTTTASNIAMWDGTTWTALGTGVNDVVRTLGVYDNELYVGGDFTSAGAAIVNHIAKWDGSAWSSLGTGTDNAVWAIEEYNGELYAGGTFNSAGSAFGSVRVARWNGSSWSNVGSSLNNSVFALKVYNGELYAGGFFDMIWATSAPASRIAKWDGSAWSALGAGVNDGVFVLHSSPTALYVGGNFTTAGTITANNISTLGNPTVGIDPIAGSVVDPVLLLPNYPNPFFGSTTIRFQLDKAGEVAFIVRDAMGRMVDRIDLGVRTSGEHAYVFKGQNLSSGSYMYDVKINGISQTGSMVVTR